MSVASEIVQRDGVTYVVRDGAPEEIPVLDLALYLAGAPGAREALAAELRHAQENIGFYYIVNHGIPQRVFDDTFAALKRFFALPDAAKLALKIDDDMIGYVPPKSTIYETSTVNRNTKKDLNETLLINRERLADDPVFRMRRRFTASNKWPAGLPGFRETMVAYQRAMEPLGRRLLPLYALALDKPADFFAPYFDDEAHIISRNSHYPPVDVEDNQFGHAPHCDHGFLTLLPVHEVPGLEILTQSGRWIPAPHIPGAILVNTGEFLNRWTNGRFIATPHRVMTPKTDRYAITFFFNPRDDALATPLDTCVGPANPARYEPMAFIDYFAYYTQGNYLHMRKQPAGATAGGEASQ